MERLALPVLLIRSDFSEPFGRLSACILNFRGRVRSQTAEKPIESRPSSPEKALNTIETNDQQNPTWPDAPLSTQSLGKQETTLMDACMSKVRRVLDGPEMVRGGQLPNLFIGTGNTRNMSYPQPSIMQMA